MTTRKSTRLFGYYIYTVLKKRSSEGNPLGIMEIVEAVKEDFGVEINRKVVPDYLDEFIQLGDIEVVYTEKGKVQKKYYMKESFFTEDELIYVLFNAIYCKNIPVDISKSILTKIKLDSIYSKMPYLRYIMKFEDQIVDNDIKINPSTTKHIKEIIDAIYMKEEIDIRGTYINSDKKRVLNREEYTRLRPFDLSMQDENFYVHVKRENRDEIEYRKIDRIHDIRQTNEKVGKDNYIKFSSAKHFDQKVKLDRYAITDSYRPVEINIIESDLFYFHEWHGKDYEVIENQNNPDPHKNMLRLRFMANIENITKWAIRYGEIITVTSPSCLVEEIQKRVKKILDKYNK